MNLKQKVYYWQFELWLDCFIYNNQYILWLRREHRSISKLILLFTSPYLLINWLVCRIYAITVGGWRVKQFLKRDKNSLNSATLL